MFTLSRGRVRAASDHLSHLFDIGPSCTLSSIPCPVARHQQAQQGIPSEGMRGLRGLRRSRGVLLLPWPAILGYPLARRPEEAVPQEIQMRPAKHGALEHFEAVDMAFDRAVTPGHRDPGFDGGIIVAQPLRKTPQGCDRAGPRALQPALETVRLVGTQQVGKLPGERDRFREFRLLHGQLGQLLFLVRIPRFWPPEHEPGGAPRREVPVLRFCHARQRLLGRPLAGLEALRLSETLGLAGHGRIAPLVALLLEAMKDLQGVMTSTIPELEDTVFVGVQNAVPAPFIGAFREGGAPQIAKDRTRGQVQLVRNGLPRPALPA